MKALYIEIKAYGLHEKKKKPKNKINKFLLIKKKLEKKLYQPIIMKFLIPTNLWNRILFFTIKFWFRLLANLFKFFSLNKT
jgi:hypothetical protein